MTDAPQEGRPGIPELPQVQGLPPGAQYVVVGMPPEGQPAPGGVPKFFWLWTLLAVVLALLAGTGAYFLGTGAGADLGAARAAGRAQGLSQGRAAGLKAGRAAGLKAGRAAGYRRAYQPAYDRAYDKAQAG